MQADVDVTDQNRTASQPQKCAGDTRPTKLIDCPFEVRIDGALRDSFYDVRDTMAFAQEAKRNKSAFTVTVIDVRTEKLVIEVDG
jgi:hypothetical protein